MGTATTPSTPARSTEELPSRSGADAIAETFMKSGIELVFGFPGGGTKTLINSLVKNGVPTFTGRTELSCAWMSYGYNRIKRRAASACVVHCVGALHASPVVYASKLDSTPLLLTIVGLSSSLDMRNALQESTDVYPALKPLSKYIKHVVTAEDLPLAVRQSVIAASSGRFGGSVLDLAFEVLEQQATCRIEELVLPEPPAANVAALTHAIEMIERAKRPVIIVGAGVHLSGAAAELREFAQTAGIPVVSTSWGGRGVLADQDPLYGGVLGSFGWRCANDLAQHADLWIAIGTSFSQMTTAAWSIEKPANIIHVDIDPDEIGKIVQPALGIIGDAKNVLRQLIDALASSGFASRRPRDEDRLRAVGAARVEWFEYMESLSSDGGSPINQYFLIKKMSERFPPGTIVVGDSGGQAFMLYRSFEYAAVTPLATGSRYMSLGSGLPVAIGAKLAQPDRVVVSYHGDGGFYYDLMELATLKHRGVKVIVIIDNNHCMLANRAGMRMMGFENPWVELPETTDFVAVAKGFGVDGERVTEASEIAPAIDRALAADGSYLIDVFTDPDTRITRAIKDVIPILSDRNPYTFEKTHQHVQAQLKKSWPS